MSDQMWYGGLKNPKFWDAVIFGGGAVTALFAAALFIGAPRNSRSFHPAYPPAATAKAAVNSPAGNAVPQNPTPAIAQLSPAQADLIKAKFDTLTAPLPVEDDNVESSLPPSPVVADVETPPAPIAPAPQPMELAMQTAEAPALVAPPPAPPAKVSYFGRGPTSIQHLPIPSH